MVETKRERGVMVMAYDENWMGGEAGPITSQPRFADLVAHLVRAVDRGKVVAVPGHYASDWSAGRIDPLAVSARRLCRYRADIGSRMRLDRPST